MNMNICTLNKVGHFALLALSMCVSSHLLAEALDVPLVSVSDVDKSIIIEMRYFSNFNFTSRRVPGYEANKCLLIGDAAHALGEAQHELHARGLTLKVYDCYRPQMAVNFFMSWAADIGESSMKLTFYPDVEKSTLVKKGYIAERSGHSRGDSVDLTLVRLPAAEQPAYDRINQKKCTAPVSERYADNSLDMGTGYDCFDVLSHTMSLEIKGEAHENRLLLKNVMERHGFSNYKREWWHYTYVSPYGQKEFYDFPVK